MFFVFRGSSVEPSSTISEPKPVDQEEYRASVSRIFQTFEKTFVSSEDSSQKKLATQQALAQLLELRVPSEYKDLHLRLAIIWNQIQADLSSESPQEVSVSLENLDQLKTSYSWLTK